MNNVGFALAVEKLCKLEVPERAQYLRTITSRDPPHLRPPHPGRRARPRAGRHDGLPLRHRGARPALGPAHRAVRRPAHLQLRPHRRRLARRAGGLDREDQPPRSTGWWRCATRSTRCSPATGSSSTGPATWARCRRADALDLGFTGPCLRASGEPYDVRKAAPYLVYDRLDFDIPVGSNGDTFDRYLMRIEEMKQSDKMIRQCFRDMAPGELVVRDFRYVLPPKPEVYGTIEGRDGPLQAHHGGDPGPGRRGLRLHRGRQRRARLLPGLRRQRPPLQAGAARARAGPCWRPCPSCCRGRCSRTWSPRSTPST